MNIKEFAVLYCQDIIERAGKSKDVFGLEGFSYDEIIEDDSGKKVKVINTANFQIPLVDILGMRRSEFENIWPETECLQAYDDYVSTIIILEGKEALDEIRNAIAREQDRLSRFVDVND